MIYGEKIKALDYIGYFGPVILVVVTVAFYMWHYSEQRHKVRAILAKFGGLLIFSSLLNAALKQMIAAPRPAGEIALFCYQPRTCDLYGMPSGHAQMVAFITSFFIKNGGNVAVNPEWFAGMVVGYVVISILTVIQRYAFRAHKLAQLFAGLVIGGVVGQMPL
jgi:membrane-associated phospholipid phosphatase